MRHFSEIAMEILQKTEGVHILVENFLHANDITQSRSGINDPSMACSPVDDGILNNLRGCLEVMMLNERHCRGDCSKRIHFIDPRVDMVSVLPDGKLFQAISHYVNDMAVEGDFTGGVLTVYEALVHPLSSLLPDKRNLRGRLVGAFETLRSKMNDKQGETFDRLWMSEIKHSVKKFNSMVEEIKQLYKVFTNKFLDVWLLAHVFMIQNLPQSEGMVMYLGNIFINYYSFTTKTRSRALLHHRSRAFASCVLP